MTTNHIDQVPQSKEDKEYWAKHLLFCTFYCQLKKASVEEFKDKCAENNYDGKLILECMIAHFEPIEMYHYCAFLKNFLDEFSRSFYFFENSPNCPNIKADNLYKKLQGKCLKN